MLSRPALNDRQLNRMAFRIGLFRRRGLSESQADALADRLADRDYERDDRTVCCECSSLQKNGGCFAAQRGRLIGVRDAQWFRPIPNVLFRCEAFEWQTP